MQAIREIKKVDKNQILITLPPGFTEDRVEVIVLPVIDNVKGNDESLREFLLNGPVFTDEVIESIKEAKESIDKWEIPEF